MAVADGVRFEHVSFTYPGGTEPAVSDVSFQLRPGESLETAQKLRALEAYIVETAGLRGSQSHDPIIWDATDGRYVREGHRHGGTERLHRTRHVKRGARRSHDA